MIKCRKRQFLYYSTQMTVNDTACIWSCSSGIFLDGNNSKLLKPKIAPYRDMNPMDKDSINGQSQLNVIHERGLLYPSVLTF